MPNIAVNDSSTVTATAALTVPEQINRAETSTVTGAAVVLLPPPPPSVLFPATVQIAGPIATAPIVAVMTLAAIGAVMRTAPIGAVATVAIISAPSLSIGAIPAVTSVALVST